MATNQSPMYTSQSSSSSSTGSESASNILQYGPIQVRVCRKGAPTLATGRRSKHLTLHGEEAIKREKRREKNRVAARKLKEKRQIIEDELNREIQDLESEHSDLQHYLAELQREKQRLEFELDQLCLNDQDSMSSFFDQYLGEFDLTVDSMENLVNVDSLYSSNCTFVARE